MTLLIKYFDPLCQLTGMDGLQTSQGTFRLSVTLEGEPRDYYFRSEAALHDLADDLIRKRLNSALLETHFDNRQRDTPKILVHYYDMFSTCGIIYAPERDNPLFRVLESLSGGIFKAPRYPHRYAAQQGFDDIIRPKLNGRYCQRHISRQVETADVTSNFASH